MNSRERVLKAINLEEPDRVPLFDIIRNDAVIEHYSRQQLTWDNAERSVHRALGNMLDMTRSVRYPHREETVRGEDGALRQYERWTTWTLEHPFRTTEELATWIRKDIQRLRSVDPRASTDEYVDRFQAVQNDIGDAVVLWGLAEVGMGTYQCGLELYSYLYADDPCLMSEWIQASNDLSVAKIEALGHPELSPVAFVGEDIAGSHGPLFSPAFLEREFFPRLREVIEAYHGKGIKVLYHSDGDIWPVMPDLISAGIDGLNPLDRQAGMHPGPLKERYGDRLFFAGGIDCVHLLPFGTPKEVREATRQAIRDGGSGGGYFVGSSSEIGPDIPLENVIAMVETVKQEGTYPIS